jgi:hypothetical protein
MGDYFTRGHALCFYFSLKSGKFCFYFSLKSGKFFLFGSSLILFTMCMVIAITLIDF